MRLWVKYVPTKCIIIGTFVLQVRILYVRNLLLSTTEIALRDAFEASAPPGSVEKVKKIKDFAFVHFKCRQSAAEALSKMHNSMLDGTRAIVVNMWMSLCEGARLEVVWAKPPDRTIMKFVRSSLKSGQVPPMQQGIAVAPTVNNPYIQQQLTNPYALVAQQYVSIDLIRLFAHL
jgi:RNA recognition motif-containing protein